MRALQIAATGMSAQQMRVEVISNNLANMSTTGYNARRAEFADLHYQQITTPGAISASDGSVVPTGIQVGDACLQMFGVSRIILKRNEDQRHVPFLAESCDALKILLILVWRDPGRRCSCVNGRAAVAASFHEV